MQLVGQESGRNTLTITLLSKGEKQRCLCLVYSNERYTKDAGKAWLVLESKGACPIFIPGVTNNEKAALKLIQKKIITIVEVIEDLLKGLFIDVINGSHIVELKKNP